MKINIRRKSGNKHLGRTQLAAAAQTRRQQRPSPHSPPAQAPACSWFLSLLRARALSCMCSLSGAHRHDGILRALSSRISVKMWRILLTISDDVMKASSDHADVSAPCLMFIPPPHALARQPPAKPSSFCHVMACDTFGKPATQVTYQSSYLPASPGPQPGVGRMRGVGGGAVAPGALTQCVCC